jgi:hypothetical protein
MSIFSDTLPPSPRRTPGLSDFDATTTLGPGLRRGDEQKIYREAQTWTS